jgi:pilus assembly protein FimV
MARLLARFSALICLTAAASGALALGFGRARVVSVLGQPLEATVPVRVEPGEELSNECLSAEVFYGEVKQPDAAVSARLRTLPNGERAVAVRSTTAVDEPVVSIYVTAGCQSRMTRKWTAFADPPTATLADAPQTLGEDRSAAAAATAPGPQAGAAPTGPSLARLPADMGPEGGPPPRYCAARQGRA